MGRESKSSFSPAVALAALVLLGSGTGFRMLAAHYARPTDSVTIPRGTLAALPMVIGEWRGTDQPLDQQIVKATDTDDLINRLYRRFGNETAAMFVGYGVNLRDLAPHRPEVCYPGAGWTHDRTERVELPTPDGDSFTCQVHHFRRGGLAVERVVVLNYYIVDGRTCPDVSLLRSTAWRQQGAASYSAQVQIVCGADVSLQAADTLVREFATEAGPLIRSLLIHAVETAIASADGNAGA